MLAIALVAAALLVGVLVSSGPAGSTSRAGNAAVTQHEQAPDAADRNDIYSAALAAREHETADSADRNTQLTYQQMLARFNDRSPDAQERNLAISGR